MPIYKQVLLVLLIAGVPLIFLLSAPKPDPDQEQINMCNELQKNALERVDCAELIHEHKRFEANKKAVEGK